MNKKMVRITYGSEEGAHKEPNYSYAHVDGIKSPITVQGSNEIVCIRKAMEKIVNPDKVLIKFERHDKADLPR